jgi:hypothetical protein
MAGVLILVMIVVKWALVLSTSTDMERFTLSVMPVFGMSGSRFMVLQILQGVVDCMLLYFTARGNGYRSAVLIGISLLLTIAAPWLEIFFAYQTRDYVSLSGSGLAITADAVMTSIRGFGFLVVDLGWHGILLLMASLHNRS